MGEKADRVGNGSENSIYSFLYLPDVVGALS